MKPFRCAGPVFVMACALLLAPLAARAQVLEQVPSDALVVIKLNKLKQTSDKMAAFADKLGLAQQVPEMADPLTSMKEEMGVQEGLDEAGDAAIVFPNLEKREDGDPAIVILVPVSDYKAFIGNFEGAKTEGDVTVATISEDEEESFIVERGKYAAITNTRNAIEQKPDGMKAAGLSAKELEGKDIVAYVNMKSARAKILPELTKNRQKIVDEFEKNMKQGAAGVRRGPGEDADTEPAAGADPKAEKFVPLMKAFLNRGLDVFEQLVRDADGATYGFSLTDAGINGTGLVEFAKESPSAKRVGEMKNTDQSLLSGLPEAKFMFYGGSSDETGAGAKIVSDFLAPLEKEFAALGADGKALQDYVNAIKAYAGAVKMSAFGMATPSGMLGQDAIIQGVGVNVGDAKAIVEAQRQMAQSQQAVYDLMSAGAPTQVKTTFNQNAKTIDGVQFDQMSTSFGAAEGEQMTPQQMQMQQMMTFMYGPGGMNAYIGQLGNDKVISAAGINDELMAKLVASAKAGQDPLSKAKGLAATREQLPKQRMIAAYVALDEIANTIANYARAFGMQVNLQLPDDLAPIGMTMGSDGGGTAIRGDLHIPAQTLQSLIAAFMQVQMQMQGGQQPGGPGGL